MDDRQIRAEQREVREHFAEQVRRELHPDAARAQRAAPEATAAEAHRRVDRRRPQPSVGRRALQEADVGGEPREPREVHRDALELEHDGARDLRLEP